MERRICPVFGAPAKMSQTTTKRMTTRLTTVYFVQTETLPLFVCYPLPDDLHLMHLPLPFTLTLYSYLPLP